MFRDVHIVFCLIGIVSMVEGSWPSENLLVVLLRLLSRCLAFHKSRQMNLLK